MKLHEIITQEDIRQAEFPAAEHGIYMHHAGVSPLPTRAVVAMNQFNERASKGDQENEWSLPRIQLARELSARLIGAKANEIALLGPTSLGLSLIANGIDWQQGDEVIYNADDYPANVYPWLDLQRQGVTPVPIYPKQPGVISWEMIESALTPRTRLVSLATCFFLSGYRIDYQTIGQKLHEREILLCLDAIQTLGAFPMDVTHVDFLCADSHKWMLGPMGSGIVYVDESKYNLVRPTLLGSWNVVSPNFIAQDKVEFYPGGRRYEPGALNFPGIIGMAASIEMLLDVGIDHIASRLLKLRKYLLDSVKPLGFKSFLDEQYTGDTNQSGIVALVHDERDLKPVIEKLTAARVTASLRHDRQGREILRVSPHFYNTTEEIDRVVALLK